MRTPCHGVLILCAAGALAGCAGSKRPELPPEDIERVQRDYLATIYRERVDLHETGLRRMKLEWDEYTAHGGALPIRDVLILSGGGAKGAFGAGFLHGWHSIHDGPAAMPEFDVVTGVSTGALIAPFAFIGTEEAYETIDEFYRNPSEDWVKKRHPFSFWPSRASMLNNDKLVGYIREQVDMVMVRGLAEGVQEQRFVLIGTTNLDRGRMRVWNLCAEARESVATGSPDRVQSILLASSAIPMAFPPIEIDGDLYVDGGASEQLYALGDTNWVFNPARVWRDRYPGVPLPRLRVWIVVNTKLEIEPGVTQPKWGEIVGRSLETLMRASLLSSLQRLQATAAAMDALEDVDIELRFVAIPDDYGPMEGDAMFDRDVMVGLSDLGRSMGADPSSWRTEVPSIAWAGEDQGQQAVERP